MAHRGIANPPPLRYLLLVAPLTHPRHDTYPLDIRLLKSINYGFAHLYHRMTVLEPLKLPPDGSAILISNHISSLDPLLLQSGCLRLIRWMMASEYYTVPGLQRLFKRLQMIPVQRNGRDTAATRTALRALRDRQVLGIFPEGKIQTTPDLLPFQTGAALLAFRTGSPIYPAYLDGIPRGQSMMGAFFRPQHGFMAFGPRIEVPRIDPSRRDLERLTWRLREAVEKLRRSVRCAMDRQIT